MKEENVVGIEEGEAEEAAADLAALLAAAGGAPMAEQAAAAEETEAKVWAQIPALLGSVIALALPEVASAFTADRCEAWGRAMVPVAERHGWSVGDVGPYPALIVASAPFVIPVVVAIKVRKQQAQQQAQQGGGEHGSSVTAGDK